MNDYQIKQDKLHTQAEEIIQKLNIANILSPLGEVVFKGSFANNLMAWPDIDISVKADNFDINKISSVITELLKTNPVRQKFTNYHIVERNPGFPFGYYLGLHYKVDDLVWKFDIWLVEPKNDKDDFDKKWFDNLSSDQRSIILTLKNQLIELDRYPSKKEKPNSVTSTQIYQAVDSGITSLDEFESWLNK